MRIQGALLAIAIALVPIGSMAQQACPTGSVVTVNGQDICRSTFDDKLESGSNASAVLQALVQQQLLVQYAAKNTIVVSDADIAAKEATIKANFPGASWDATLKARGLTEADVHDVLRDQIIIDRAVGGNIRVTEPQISAYFAKNHAQFDGPATVDARHILVADLATANKVEALLKRGGDFAKLAQQYSIDPGSKSRGGEIGTFHRGEMVAAFDQASFTQPVGKIGSPVKSPFGYHIIEVESRTQGTTATLASVHDKIAQALHDQQEAALSQPFLSGLMAKATIQVQDPRFAGIFPTPAPSATPRP